MIIRKNKTYETHGKYPNSNFYPNEPDNIIIDETTIEGKHFAEMVKENAPYFDIVFNGNGNIIDITPLEKPIDILAYKELRRMEYPPIGDQLDAIWKILTPPVGSEAEAMKTTIEAVKAKYPKPIV